MLSLFDGAFFIVFAAIVATPELKIRLRNRRRALRVIKGLSQEKLGELIGLTQPRVSQIEAGEREPRPETANAIAEHLECDVAVLFPEIAELGVADDD